METIGEIKKIEINLLPDNAYSFRINDGGTEEVEWKVPAENYRQWARVFTRMAMEMWARMDETMLKEDKK